MTDTTLDTPTTDVAAAADAHIEAYGEPDGARRRALVEAAWTPDGTLVDPPFVPTTGHDAIDRLYAEVQALYPGHTFRRTTAVDAHHAFARYGWEMVGPDGAVVLAGTDVVEVGSDGRLAGVVGFFGEPEAR
jgi:hypothetical protein